PLVPLDEVLHRVLGRLRCVLDDVETSPLHAAADVSTIPGVLVLSIVDVGHVGPPFPWQPSLGIDHVGHAALHEHHARERRAVRDRLPRPAEVGLHAAGGGAAEEVVVGVDVAVLEREAGGAGRRGEGLGGDGVLLAAEGEAGDDVAVLEDGGGVAEDEVDGAGDAAVAVELPVALGVQRVLVHPDAAAVQRRGVGVGQQRHRLLVLCSGRVLDGQINGDEANAINSCTHIYIVTFIHKENET
ncbi:Os09g0545550, partial [Oryza sativa Japonica Group]